MKKYNLPCIEELAERSLTIAMEQIGVKEKTAKNDGPEVEAYLSVLGLKKGNPYCAAGQYYCFHKACLELNLDTKLIPLAKSGLALDSYRKARKFGIDVYPKPEVGDIIIWEKPNKINGHMERIIEILNFTTVKTVAFNTSNGLTGNQRDGDGVFKRKRYLDRSMGDMELVCLIGFVKGD